MVRNPLRYAAILLAALLAAAACTQDEPSTVDTTAKTTASIGDSCSASGLPFETEARDNLSEEAEATRRALIDAAIRCDFGAVADFAVAGTEPFEFDGGGELASALQEQEAAGEEPLRVLVLLLRGTMGTVASGTIEYRFPSAAGFSSWSEVPDLLRKKLAPLYTEEDWTGFEAAGVYDGYRTVISDSGEWLSFRTTR